MTPRLGLALGVAGLPLSAYGAIAARAEAAGADTLAVGEAHHDSFVAAAAVAGATRRVRVLTGVSTWVRPPVLTAMAAMSVDEVSGPPGEGRFTLGLGTMPADWNRRFFGVDPSRPLERMREYVAVVRSALGGGPVHEEGSRFPVDGWRRLGPPPARRVPVHLAVTRPGMARLAGEVADGALLNVVSTPRWRRARLHPALAAGRAAVGRRGDAFEVGGMVRVVLHDGTHAGRRDAVAAARSSLALYRDVPYAREIAAFEGVDLDGPAAPDRFVVVGTPDEVADRLAAVDDLDWAELVPPTGLAAGALAEQYDGLLELVAASATPAPAMASPSPTS